MTFAAIVAAPFATAAGTEPRILVAAGTTDYGIYADPAAAACVKDAADEIRRVVEIATGVKLPMLEAPRERMISLGDNPAARAAGISAADLPAEGFHLRTRGPTIFIVGHDWPDDKPEWAGCTSIGTYYGSCEFLERCVGVRWLMPGEWGEDVPRHPQRLIVPDLAVTESPAAAARSIGDLPGGNPGNRMGLWFRRNRIGSSQRPEYGHSFSRFPPTDVLLAHPEYMPLREDGTREKPAGGRAMDARGNDEHKLCLSNRGLVQAFAESVNAAIDADPHNQFIGIGPSDGGRWCVCPECSRFTITDPTGPWGDFAGYRTSVTPLVLQFYNEVGRRVAARHAKHCVGGWVYSEYLFPPPEPTRIEPNVHLQIGSTDDYGYKLYRQDRRDRVERLIKAWARIAPRLGWTDYSLWMRNPFGAPLPPGLPLLKTIYPAFGRSLASISAAGHPWGYGGPLNYLQARLMWNNAADVDAIYTEYLERAYGPAAGSIRRIHEIVEESLAAYVRTTPRTDHEIWYETAVKVYVPIFPEIERLYREAIERAETEPQRKRLEMFGENLIVLAWNLRQAGLLEPRPGSPLDLGDEAFAAFMGARKDSLAIRGDLEFYVQRNWQTVLWSPEHRELVVPALPKGCAPPVIDGRATERAWEQAGLADDFRANGGRRGPAKRQTGARLAHDGTRLFLTFACADDPGAKPRGNCRNRDSAALFADDYVQILIQPPGRPIASLAVNVAGTRHTAPEKATVETAVASDPGGWSIEAAIPFRELGLPVPTPGTLWRINLVRGRRGSGYEMSAWSRVEESLTDERAFGTCRF